MNVSQGGTNDMRRHRSPIGDIREQSYREVEDENIRLNRILKVAVFFFVIVFAMVIIYYREIQKNSPEQSAQYKIKTVGQEEETAPIYVYFSKSDSGYGDQLMVLQEISSSNIPNYSDKAQLITVDCSDPLRKNDMITYLKSMGYTNVKSQSEVLG